MNKYIKIIFALFITGSFIACDLDRYPYNTIPRRYEFQTMTDARSWDNGLFAMFRTRHTGMFTLAQDVQADQLNATTGFGNRMGQFHTWHLTASNGDILAIWRAYYSAIAHANHIINSQPTFIEEGRYIVTNADGSVNETATEANRALLRTYLGNAHFARAFYHHQLMLRWSNPAVPASLSVPIVTEFDIHQLPARATVAQVHQFILEDIAIAREKLAGVTNAPRAIRFTPDVVDALEARVRFFMEDWVGAFLIADRLIDSGRYPLETTAAGMNTLWASDASSEVIMQPHVGTPANGEMPGGTNNIYIRRMPYFDAEGRHQGHLDWFSPDFLPSQWIINMFAANDHRTARYFSNAGNRVIVDGQEFAPGLITRVWKFPGNQAIHGNALWGGAGNNQMSAGHVVSNVHAPKPFRIAEMHLIAAESAFMAGEPGMALTALNRLRVARGIGQTFGGGDVLLQAIRDERTRELAFEGFRLWDLRRWNLPMERRDPQTNAMAILNQGTTFTNQYIPAGDHRFIWGIPSNDMQSNPNLVQNPGW